MLGPLRIYHDMHNRYGESLTWKPLSSHPRYFKLWTQYAHDPLLLDHSYSQLLVEYIERFRDLFLGIYPISFHSHATDAMSPTTITSLLLHMARTSESQNSSIAETRSSMEVVARALGWNRNHVQSPKVVILSRCFGAGYGPLAYVCPYQESSSVACGSSPVVIDLAADGQYHEALMKAKEQGCVALIVQIVESQFPWRKIEPASLQALAQACCSLRILLMVDETLSALRCGAPFAYQREEYRRIVRPDLVIFGKGLKVNGIGVNFDGQTLQSLHISSHNDRLRAIFRWHDRHTRAIRSSLLIEALFVIELAKKEHWPGLSIRIGQAIREVISTMDTARARRPQSQSSLEMAGLESLIYVDEKQARSMLLQGVPEGNYIRLLPALAEPYSNPQFLWTHIFGRSSWAVRRSTALLLESTGLTPLWCFVCGDATEKVLGDDVSWCRDCCLATCGYRECEEGFASHACLGHKQKL
ncbi:hypothetical protein DER44DRAFT_254353 [Fusarium oxysporum]|nr:hypothetical protein DER44DRAFT_254353 [Fusarium oxysporum]